MASPWVSLPRSRDLLDKQQPEAGTVFEAVWYDEDGGEQGHGILCIEDVMDTEAGVAAKVSHLAVEDDYYDWWVRNERSDPDLVFFPTEKGPLSDLLVRTEEGGEKVLAVPVHKFRILQRKFIEEHKIEWLKKRPKWESRVLEAFQPDPQTWESKVDRRRRSKSPLRKGSHQVFSPSQSPEKSHTRLDKKEPGNLQEELKVLKDDLERSPPPRKKHGKPGVEHKHPGEQNRAKEEGKKGHFGEKSDEGKEDSGGEQGRLARNRKSRSVSEKSKEEKKRSRSRKYKRRESQSRKSRRRKRSISSRSRSASPSVFRVASSSGTRGGQLALKRYAEKHPGKLTADIVRMMAKTVSLEGEAKQRSYDELPAIAKAYVLRVLRIQFTNMSLRYQVDLRLLATALDHLLSKRY